MGLSLRKWLDVPVVLLANVIVDVEVLASPGWDFHRYWHWHSLLVGAGVGMLLGVAMYPLRGVFKKIMNLLRVGYEPGFWKMVISGIVGVWLHVLVDAIYHYDVQPFWPFYKRNPLFKLLSQGDVKLVCAIFFIPAVVVYALAVRSYIRQKSKPQQEQELSRAPGDTR